MKYRHLFTPETVSPSYRTYRSGRILMRIDFFRHMLRVALLRDGERLLPGYHICPDGVSCPVSGRDRLSVEGLEPACPEVTEEGGTVRFTLDGVRFTVELLNFRITAENERGLLYRDRGGLAYNFAHELGDGSAHFTDRFPDQRIFGLGDKCGHVNKTGRSFVLGAGDAMGFRAECSDPLYKYFPFYICAHAAGSYGLFYDTHSLGRFNFGEEHDNYFEPFNSARFEEENLVFYLFTGSVREIIRRFSRLTGTAAPVPEWAFRYCGSTMDYTDAPDADRRLRGFLEQCDGCGIRPGGFYLSSGYTSIGEKRCVFHWNREKIPDPAGLSAHFRAHGAELVANVKPAFLTDHPLYPRIAEHGWFLYDRDRKPALFPFWGGFASLLDFTNPGAYEFWKCCVKEHLVSYGIRSIWNDNNEYTVQDREILAFGFGQEVPARLIRPVFPYL
ncbi:MAG: hypothetical protein J6Z23_00695, partial [Lachnospiraceae bacterium]|nr:hypothetical protein [Lachnospiraceae bacterium]